ncbi:hypothetical protein FPZ43_13875 [Mucilaginibacter pallidiroseus]|uniref:Uncharacterized protein n=1 Tax=Mucilaginibacter pallidiroseus TaxID=2599295 RepID=A0A563U894_9SPHI|nr:hypothetical protein [Mucilaginibacter pallidiroseus]TWR27555.1 hypothetical protein FPZ43_13875 [Mucilaginibacter pallidiroseus]
MINLKHVFTKYTTIILLLSAVTTLHACKGTGGKKDPKLGNQKDEKGNVIPSFKAVWGRGYTEVRRNFANGISFGDYGYQLEPEWRLSFPSDDSVTIYNPKRKMFVTAPVMFDHDSIFNIAWSWMKLRKLTKDSILFQVMKVENQALLREKSVVYMKLYANDYIKNVLHTTPAELIKPNKHDTAYIIDKVAKANADTANAFAGRQMVELKSKSPLVTVVRKNLTEENKTQSAIPSDYMLPEFNISIKNAYEDFSYSFTAVVDQNGRILFRKSLNFAYEEFEESTNKVIRAITDGYLKAYLKVTPGSTLGMPHSSVVILHVSGTKKS